MTNKELEAEVTRLRDALDFYADPETYFAVAFLGDPPCGPFLEDFSETELGRKPGNVARVVLAGDPLPEYARLELDDESETGSNSQGGG